MPRWPQARAGRNEAQSADTRGGIAPPRSNDALRSAPLTQGGASRVLRKIRPIALTLPPQHLPAAALSATEITPLRQPPSLQHCQLRRLLRRGTAACGKLPVSAPPAATPARSLTTLLRPTREASRYVDVIYAGPTSSSPSNTTATPSIRTQASFTLIQAEDQPWKRQGFMLSPSRKTRFSAGANYLTLQQ